MEKEIKNLKQETTESLESRKFLLDEKIATRRIRQQDIIIIALLSMFGFALCATIGLLYLQGLHKIYLDNSVLHWVGLATLGELASLLTIGIKGAFR